MSPSFATVLPGAAHYALLRGAARNLQAERAKPLRGCGAAMLRDATQCYSPEDFVLSARGLSRSTLAQHPEERGA